jgi:hypothetical protein
MRKEQRQALEARAARAIKALYHAATPAWPRDFGPYADSFDQWLGERGSEEIDYLSGGGGYGRDYRATLAAPCNAGRYQSEAARRRYIAKGLREQAADLDKRPQYLARDMFGTIYQWGRGGRTVAPEGLIRQGGGSSFSMSADALAEMSAETLTQAVRVIEAFGEHVQAWNKSVPEQWAEYTADRAAEEMAEARDVLKSARESVGALLAEIRRIRAAGAGATPHVCDVLAAHVKSWRRDMAEARQTLARLATVGTPQAA